MVIKMVKWPTVASFCLVVFIKWWQKDSLLGPLSHSCFN